MWFAIRQAALARTLWKLGLGGYWLSNGTSAIDTLIVASVAVVVLAILLPGAFSTYVFVSVAGLSAGLCWLKLLVASKTTQGGRLSLKETDFRWRWSRPIGKENLKGERSNAN